ncbi:hypothetical protein HDV06_003995 [Boothiomyces sp. JEL0866]|nr:hypothetical protein HDV06_003995 [Boothiomyces sp. JEL0866]
MKRQREEIESSDVDQKTTPEEQYLMYIRLRLRDNSSAVEEGNPNRFENALFELSFHLSLSKEMRQQSYKYIASIKRNGPLNIQSLFMQTCACVWSAELTLTKRNGLYPISVLLNVLHKVTKFVSESGHLLYEPVFFDTFFSNFKIALQAIEVSEPNLGLLTILQNIYSLYLQQMEKYHHYRTIFQSLIRLENSDYSNLKADQFKTESMLDIFRYGWLLILLSDVDLKNKSLTNVIGIIGFVASHISSVRTMGELVTKLPMLPNCSPDIYDLPWTSHFKEVLEFLRNYYNCDSNVYADVESFLQYLKANSLLLCTEEVLEPGSFWRIYKMAFDGGPQGLLQVNLQNIMSRLDKELKPRMYQLDFIAFVPTWDRTVAAPKKFLRTPAQSTSKRSTMRNLCRVASVSSGLDNKMTVTPLSAMGQVGIKSEKKDDIKVLLQQKFARIDIHSTQFMEQMPVYIQERASKIIETMKVQMPATKDVWDFALKIYYNLFIYLLNVDPDLRDDQKFYKEIAADGQFHRAVMCISMELARLAYNLNTVTFEALIRHCIANIVDLSLVIELLKEYVIKQPEWPRDVIKRLYELHERTTETELWTDPQFYQFLEFENSKANQNYLEFFAVSKTVLFFGYIQSKMKVKVPNGPHLAKYDYLDQSKFQGYLSKDILMECITNDHKYRLISNRHLDIVIICSIYLAGTIIAHKPEITFKGLVAQYEKFPQYFYKTVKQIYISNSGSIDYNNNCDIVEFYKSVFLPVLTPYLSLKENCEPQALSNAINFNFEKMKLNNDYLLTSPIRRDAMKTKKKLSFNSPGFSSPSAKSPLTYAPCTPSKLGQYVFVDSYVGDFANDGEERYHGNGTVNFQSGGSYTGQFKDGNMHGDGIYNWNDGVVYQGQFDSDRILGSGQYTWYPDTKARNTETSYKGQLENGLRHGTGVFTVKNKFIDGEWARGKPNGYCVCQYEDHSVYSGNWKNGKKDGNGKMLYQSGNYYVGEWKDDQKCGKGKMMWLDKNEEYEGNWENGLPNGFGQYIWKLKPLRDHQYPLQNMYRGYWVEGKREGYGVFFYSSGAKYEGNWKNNLKDGYGKFISENGRVYEGQFVADRPVEKIEFFNNLMPFLFHIPQDAGPDSNNQITLELNKVIFRYSSELREVYHRCSTKTRTIRGYQTKNTIIKSVVWNLLKSVNILSLGHSIAELNRAYAIEFKSEAVFQEKYNDPHNRKTEMIFHDFLEYLLLVSHHVYKNTKNLSLHENGIIASFSFMIKNHLVPYLQKNANIPKQPEHSVVSTWEAACEAFESQMEELYAELHHRSKTSLLGSSNDKTITFREFILILKDFEIFQKYGHELNVKNMVVDEFINCTNACAKMAASHIISKIEFAEKNPQEEEIPLAAATTVNEVPPIVETTAHVTIPVTAATPQPPVNPPDQKVETPSSARRKSVIASKVATVLMVNTVKKRLSKIEMGSGEQDTSSRPSTTVKNIDEKEPVKIDRVTELKNLYTDTVHSFFNQMIRCNQEGQEAIKLINSFLRRKSFVATLHEVAQIASQRYSTVRKTDSAKSEPKSNGEKEEF